VSECEQAVAALWEEQLSLLKRAVVSLNTGGGDPEAERRFLRNAQVDGPRRLEELVDRFGAQEAHDAYFKVTPRYAGRLDKVAKCMHGTGEGN